MKDDYLRQIFEKCVAAIVGSHNLRMDKATFQYIVLLAELRMQQTFSDLAQIARLQRRPTPNLSDLMLWMTRNNIDLVDSRAPSGPRVEALNSLKFSFDLEEVTPESEVFFNPQLFQIKNIIQSREELPSYAPEWSPPLPPDHTYMATADYPNQVRALQDLHDKLFSEGHLAQLALQRLLGSNGSASAINLGFPGSEQRDGAGAVNVVSGTSAPLEMPNPEEQVPEGVQEAQVAAQPEAQPEEDEPMEDVVESAQVTEEAVAREAEPSSVEPLEEPSVEPSASVEPSVEPSEPLASEPLESLEPSLEPSKPQESPAQSEPTETSEPVESAPSEPTPAPPQAPLKLGFKLSFKPPAPEPEPEPEPEPQPASYITVVQNEPAPEPPKPVLKISLRKPKKQRTSTRPKIDIVELAHQHSQKQEEPVSEAASDLASLLSRAVAGQRAQ